LAVLPLFYSILSKKKSSDIASGSIDANTLKTL